MWQSEVQQKQNEFDQNNGLHVRKMPTIFGEQMPANAREKNQLHFEKPLEARYERIFRGISIL